MSDVTIRCMYCGNELDDSDQEGYGCKDCGTFRPWSQLSVPTVCPDCDGNPMIGGEMQNGDEYTLGYMRPVWCSTCNGTGEIRI